MFASAALFSSSPYLLPFVLFGQAQEVMRGFQETLLAVPEAYARGRLLMPIHDDHRDILAELTQPVEKTDVAGQYRGAVMDRLHTLRAAELGDRNRVHVDPDSPHPLFGENIAHGMDAVTEGFAALRLVLGNSRLVPKKATISFRKPVLLNGHRLWIDVHPSPLEPLAWEIVISHGVDPTTAKTVVKMQVELEEDQRFDEEARFQWHMAKWGISALLAETWKGCLYFEQILFFRHPMDGDAVEISVRGTGRTEKGYIRVHTQANRPGRSLVPAVTGQAIIVPATAT